MSVGTIAFYHIHFTRFSLRYQERQRRQRTSEHSVFRDSCIHFPRYQWHP